MNDVINRQSVEVHSTEVPVGGDIAQFAPRRTGKGIDETVGLRETPL